MARGGALTRGLITGAGLGVIVGGVLIGGTALFLDGVKTAGPPSALPTSEGETSEVAVVDRGDQNQPGTTALGSGATDDAKRPELEGQTGSRTDEGAAGDVTDPSASIQTAAVNRTQDDGSLNGSDEPAQVGSEKDESDNAALPLTEVALPEVSERPSAPLAPALDTAAYRAPFLNPRTEVRLRGHDALDTHAAPVHPTVAIIPSAASDAPTPSLTRPVPASPAIEPFGGRPVVTPGLVALASDDLVKPSVPQVSLLRQTDLPQGPEAPFTRVAIETADIDIDTDPRPRIAFLLDVQDGGVTTVPTWAQSVLLAPGVGVVPEPVDDTVVAVPDLDTVGTFKEFGRRVTAQNGTSILFVDNVGADGKLLDLVRTTGHALVLSQGSDGAWVSMARNAAPASAVVYADLDVSGDGVADAMARAVERAERDGGAVVRVPDAAAVRDAVTAWLGAEADQEKFAIVSVSDLVRHNIDARTP